MPRTCTICSHTQRAEIDRLLAGGASCLQLATWFAVSDDALQRHKTAHLLVAHAGKVETAAPGLLDPEEPLPVVDQAFLTNPGPVLERLRDLQGRTLAAVRRAEAEGDLRAFLMAVRAARANFDLLARLEARAAEVPPELDLFTHPQWVALRTSLFEALAPFQEARLAVSRCLAAARTAPPEDPDHGSAG